MKPSRLLLYALVLLAVSSYIFFVEHGYKERKHSQEIHDAKFFGLDKENIIKMEVYGPSGVSFQLHKPASDWVIVSPIKSRADEYVVNAMLNALSEASPERMISDRDVKWYDYGFDKHTLTVAIGTDQGKNYKLVFGAKNPSQSSYYAKLDDNNKLYLVADTLKNALDKTLFDLRDKTVMTFAPSDIDRLVIQKKGTNNEFLREGVSQWKMVAPEQFRVKNVAISTFLRKLSHLNAAQIIDTPGNDPEKFGLKVPDETILLFGKDFQQVLHIGSQLTPDADSSLKRGYYVKVDGSDTVFVIDDPSITGFKMDADALEDKSLLSLNTQDVSSIEVLLDERKVNIRKSEDKKWILEEQGSVESVKDWQITGILWKLRDLDFVSLTSPIPNSLNELGLSDPEMVINLNHGDPSKAKTLRFGWIRKTEADSNGSQTNHQSTEPQQKAGEKNSPIDEDINVPTAVNVIVEPSFYPNTLFQVDGVLVKGLIDDLLTLINGKQSDMKNDSNN